METVSSRDIDLSHRSQQRDYCRGLSPDLRATSRARLRKDSLNAVIPFMRLISVFPLVARGVFYSAGIRPLLFRPRYNRSVRSRDLWPWSVCCTTTSPFTGRLASCTVRHSNDARNFLELRNPANKPRDITRAGSRFLPRHIDLIERSADSKGRLKITGGISQKFLLRSTRLSHLGRPVNYLFGWRAQDPPRALPIVFTCDQLWWMLTELDRRS